MEFSARTNGHDVRVLCETEDNFEDSYTATWCPVCDKQVSVEGSDTRRLLAHVRKHHPKLTGKCLDNQRDEASRISSNQISSSVTSVTPVQHVASSSSSSSSSKKNDPKKVYARVDTWKSHNEKKLCPQCRRKAIPTLHTRGDKLTTSHIGALCLFGCWPFCFIPLMMKRARKVRMICPLCGHVYGIYEYKNAELTPCEPADARNSGTRLASSSANFRVKATREESH